MTSGWGAVRVYQRTRFRPRPNRLGRKRRSYGRTPELSSEGFFVEGKDLALKGEKPPKIEDKQLPGIYIIYIPGIYHIPLKAIYNY